jgi:hypothetical protein
MPYALDMVLGDLLSVATIADEGQTETALKTVVHGNRFT